MKNISLFTKGKSLALIAHPGPHEGRFAIVTTRRAGIAMDAGGFTRRRKPSRTVKSCGSDAAKTGVKFVGSLAVSRGRR